MPFSIEYRPNSKYNRSQFKGRGPEYTFGDYHRDPSPKGPGPGDHDVNFDTSGEPGKTFGLKTYRKRKVLMVFMCYIFQMTNPINSYIASFMRQDK